MEKQSVLILFLFVQELKPDFANKKIHAQKESIYRFLQRNCYSFRGPSHIGQPLPSNYNNLFLIFQEKVIIS